MRVVLSAVALASLGVAACKMRPEVRIPERLWAAPVDGRPPLTLERDPAPGGKPAPVLDLLARELRQQFAELRAEGLDTPPAYFLAYQLTTEQRLWMEFGDGAKVRADLAKERLLDVDVRVGSPELDNSRAVEGDYGPGRGLGIGIPVALEDQETSLRQALWVATEQQYRDAVTTLGNVESDDQLTVEGEGPTAPDFSAEEAAKRFEAIPSLDLQGIRTAWQPELAKVAKLLANDPALVQQSRVVLSASAQGRQFVSSEGTRTQSGTTSVRVSLEAATQAEDGMRLFRSRAFDVHTADQLPKPEALQAAATALLEELAALRSAPLGEPFTGPAVLEGRAAGVFFHEIFGHRMEAHRQKDDLEGQTFAGKLNQRILPTFLDVVDDPTVTRLGGVPLAGHYRVDDEGIPAQAAALVERGKLKGFLMGRSVVHPFEHSNGHGRRQPGHAVVARQGNLIVRSRKAVSRAKLREQLVAQVRKQGKPYGLWFSDIEGGYTTTDRSGPQAFKVLPLLVYKVFPDGRPDELVRGVDIVGTPLSVFENIIATDDEPGIFNGMCGAESGWVPVSAVSPSLLLSRLEVERAAHDRERPPLLPPPGVGTDRSAAAPEAP